MSRRFATTALLAVLAWSVLAVPAQGRTGRHCVYRLVTIDRHGSVNETRADLIGCYATFSEAISAGTQGHVRLPASMCPEQLTVRVLAAASTGTRAGDVVLGTEFNLNGYAGASKNWTAAATCSANDIWDINYVGDQYNDMFNSGKGFGGCDHNRKFEHADFGGEAMTCTPNCSNYGTLANEVSSLRYRP
jgi:hypothetical protein